MATTINMVYPDKINSATTNTAGGVNVGPIVSISDKASGGAIGTAAATVDVGSVFLVNQTTSSQTLTIPTPTTADYKLITIINVGSTSFTVASTSVATGTGLVMQYANSTWNVLGGSYAAASGVFSGAVTSASPTAGLGYAVGAGGAVIQGTSRTTGVTLNKVAGTITLYSTAGSSTPATFIVTNSTVAATDTIVISQKTGTDAYSATISGVSAGAFKVTIADLTGTTSEAPVFSFSVIKSVAS